MCHFFMFNVDRIGCVYSVKWSMGTNQFKMKPTQAKFMYMVVFKTAMVDKKRTI